MPVSPQRGFSLRAGIGVVVLFMTGTWQSSLAQEINWKASPSTPPAAERGPEDSKRSLPINLPTALKLARVQPIDIQVAAQRGLAAQAQLERAKVLWLPTLYAGIDYTRQDGQIQDVAGNVFGTNKSSVMVGAGPYAVFAVSDAIYAPLSARQIVQARSFDQQAALNDTMLSVGEAYFGVQQARGELAGALDAAKRCRDLVNRTEKLAASLANPVEIHRTKAELARREIAIEWAHERWQTNSSELARLLRLDATAIAEPIEPPHLRIEMLDASITVDEFIPIALRNRPELASQQALVQATLVRLKQERMRPLIPSVLLRGNATNPGGTLSTGTFGGGINSGVSGFGARQSLDLQVLWEFQNLGLGNRAVIRERQADNQVALLELFRVQDRIAAEVAQAHEQARRAANRARLATEGLQDAMESAQKNLDGLTQTRRSGELLVLVFRPQEVVAAIQALDQAYRDFYGAVADANRAQFRLYRALGKPAQCVMSDSTDTAPLIRGMPARADLP